MPKKIFNNLLFTALIATITLFAGTPAIADYDGVCMANANIPCNLDTFETFLLNQDCPEQGPYFNPPEPTSIEQVCEPLTTIDFDGLYYMTAIASEADNCLEVAYPDASSPIFDNKLRSNWGLFSVIDLGTSTNHVVFKDITKGVQFNLDPYCPAGSEDNCDRFQICQLVQNSNLLDYLDHPITLFAGDIIIGFDDNRDESRDEDFADKIVVLRPIEEPAPFEPLVTRRLFNAEANFFILFDLKGNSFDVECAKLEGGEWVPAPGECEITTFSLEDISWDGFTLLSAPADLPWGASESPGCSYVRTRSGSVKRICR